ncbi:MAG TPA: arylsulfotransferase family protein [Myxococcota bacterium]|nr:arylsulfotransferase family protein [Myxococcota bacterium]
MRRLFATSFVIAITCATTSEAPPVCRAFEPTDAFEHVLPQEYQRGACGTVPYPSNTGHATPDPILVSPDVWSFVSEPKLHPMKVAINTYKEGTSSGLILVAPYAFSGEAIYGQSGALMIDDDGNPVWFRPLSNPNLMNLDFRVQTWQGNPVLTFWQGTLATPPGYTSVPAGSSEPGSCFYILDNSYQVIKTVKAHKGFTSDVHEFRITKEGTALFLSTKVVPMDLTAYGGPEDGYVQNFASELLIAKANELLKSCS